MWSKLKIAYIHGRFGPHIMHGKLAKSVGSEFHIVDQYKEWNEGERSKLYLIYAWIYNAFAFKNIKKYKLFLISGPHFSPIIMKFFRLNRKQKVLVHLGDETMYFLYSNWYGKVMQKTLVWLLNRYDALLCEGQMAADLAVLNGIRKPKIYTTYLGVPKERQNKLLELEPQLKTNNLIFISAGPRGWRTHYKGLDLMIDAYSKAFEKEPSLTFTIVGEWDDEVQNELTKDCSNECKNSIHFVGRTEEIERYLSKACFYFHTARGDAFPTVVLEAMSSGLIPLVSEWTGSKEVVGDVDASLVVELDKNTIAKQLITLTQLEIPKREELSNLMREKSKQFTEEFALQHYQDTFDKICNDLNIQI